VRYHEITDTGATRFRLPASHPFVAKITIDPVHWHDLQRLDADDLATHIVGRPAPQNGKMVVYVACVSLAVRDRVENVLLGLINVRR
jgi:hypothetical protein